MNKWLKHTDNNTTAREARNNVSSLARMTCDMWHVSSPLPFPDNLVSPLPGSWKFRFDLTNLANKARSLVFILHIWSCFGFYCHYLLSKWVHLFSLSCLRLSQVCRYEFIQVILHYFEMGWWGNLKFKTFVITFNGISSFCDVIIRKYCTFPVS